MPWSISALTALVEVQVRVADWPRTIDVGWALRVTVGPVMGGTVVKSTLRMRRLP